MKGPRDAKVVVQQMISVVKSCVAKAKLMAMIRNKTDAMKARVMVTTMTVLSKKKKLGVGAISEKINDAIDGIMSKHPKHRPRTSTTISSGEENEDDNELAVVLYDNNYRCMHDDREKVVVLAASDDDDGYPDLRHSLFEEEDKNELEEELEDLLASGVDPHANGESVIELVKNSKENFNLEEEIDEVADLFITKFHKRMRLQKLLSFKRYQQMLERSA